MRPPRSLPGSLAVLVLTPLLALGGAGCGPEQQVLEGSLSEVVELGWRTAEVQTSQDELSLRFVQSQGAGENVVLRITAGLLGTSVDAEEPLPLAEPDPLGNPRGRITRNVAGDPLTDFPAIERGELLFHRSVLSGATVPGEFHITFVQGTGPANGRTVFGSFEAKVE